MSKTPYEEINELVKTLQQTKELTLVGTDLEYFTKEQLLSLIEISKQVIHVSETMISNMEI